MPDAKSRRPASDFPNVEPEAAARRAGVGRAVHITISRTGFYYRDIG
jgi:hypothetical protein